MLILSQCYFDLGYINQIPVTLDSDYVLCFPSEPTGERCLSIKPDNAISQCLEGLPLLYPLKYSLRSPLNYAVGRDS